MTITRFDPTEGLRPLPAGATANTPTGGHPLPSVCPLTYDVYRVEDELCIDFDVPGIDPAAIHLSLDDRVLVLVVTRELVTVGIDVIERGRAHGTFEQRLLLPRQWGVDELRATCTNGVLQVRAPLVRPSARRPIEIVTNNRVEQLPAPLAPPASDEFYAAAHGRVGSAA